MAALVTGLIPILRTAVDTTTTYKCRSLWFGFLCVRLVVLFVAELPWFKLDSDFSCNATKDSICVQACYNQHFDKPVMMAWNFLFILLILSVLLMELFASHLRAVAQKRACKSGGGDGNAELAGSADTRMVIDLHKNKSTVGFYLFSIVLRIAVETCFVYVLLTWNLPRLADGTFGCKMNVCGDEVLCIVRASPEKRMSIYTLASISILVIVASLVFCLYSIAHYLCNSG